MNIKKATPLTLGEPISMLKTKLDHVEANVTVSDHPLKIAVFEFNDNLHHERPLALETTFDAINREQR